MTVRRKLGMISENKVVQKLIVFSFDYVAFQNPPSLKFHNQTDIRLLIWYGRKKEKYCAVLKISRYYINVMSSKTSLPEYPWRQLHLSIAGFEVKLESGNQIGIHMPPLEQ